MPEIKTRSLSVKVPTQHIESRVLKESIDIEARTVKMIFSTEKPVRTFRWEGWDLKEFNEILSMDPKHMRSSRLDKGSVPLLNSHSRYGLHSILGTVVSAEFKNKALEGVVKFSKRKDVQEIFEDVIDGVLSNGSVGYRVYKYQDESKDDDKVKTLRAIDWELIEMSLVAVGADESAGTFNGKRSEEGAQEEFHDCEIVMNENQRCESILRTDSPLQGEEMSKVNEKQGGAENKESAAVELEAARKEAAAQERARVSEIHEIAKSAKLSSEDVKRFIDDGTAVDAVRKFAIDQFAKQDQGDTRSQISTVEITRDGEMTRREGMLESLQFRAGVKGVVLTEKGQMFRTMGLLDMARMCAKLERDYGVSKNEIIRRALTTSDFPIILADAVNKSLQRQYLEKAQSFEPIVRRVPLADFKAKNVVKMGDFPELKKKNENGEIEKGPISEGKENYKLASYAREVMITREMIINDDLDAFSRLPEMAARRARQKESDLVYALITTNPTMGDGRKLFSAQHNNISGAAAPSVDELSKLIQKIRAQKGLDGAHIDLQPEYLVGPTALEAVFANLLDKTVVPTKAEDANPWSRILKGYIVDSRLDVHSSTKWYMAAGKEQIDTIELGTLDGQGPQVNTEDIFATGMKMSILHDVGAGLIDHRGFAGNGAF